jgi:hypothetical protein
MRPRKNKLDDESDFERITLRELRRMFPVPQWSRQHLAQPFWHLLPLWHQEPFWQHLEKVSPSTRRRILTECLTICVEQGMLPKPLADVLRNELKSETAPRDRVHDEEQMHAAARYLASHPKTATLGNIAQHVGLPAKNKTTIREYMMRKEGLFWQFAINEAHAANRPAEKQQHEESEEDRDRRLNENLKRRKRLRESLDAINDLRMKYNPAHRTRMRYDKRRAKQIERRPRGLGRVRPGYLGPFPIKGEDTD